MNDPAAKGHNNPPDPLDEITAPFDDDRAEAESWLDGKPVENEAQMDAVDALRKQMRSWRLALEAGQKDATAPLHDIYKAEMERWKPTIADAKLIETGLVALVDGFKKKLAAEKELARKAAWEASEKARREAEALIAQANAGDITAQREAQAAMDAADLARAQASAAQKDTVKGMRLVHKWEFTDTPEITGRKAALNWIAANDREAITAFIDGYCAKHFKDAQITGVRVWQDKEAY